MIRILYMSDLHLEMERWRLPIPGWASFRARHRAAPDHPSRGPMLAGITGLAGGAVDLIVLAGDIHNGLRGLVYADQLARYLGAPVVMVAGNHEFYHHDFATLLPAMREATVKTKGRVSFLENAVARFEIRGRALNVFGCTLWTDYALHGTPEPSMAAARARMNDHRFIQNGAKRFYPADALACHERSRAWLHEALAAARATDPAATNIVVTHHAPGDTVLGNRTGEIAPCYGSHLLAEFAPARPALWIHGHTHYRHVSVLEGLLVVSAPRGYVISADEDALRFLPGIVEI